MLSHPFQWQRPGLEEREPRWWILGTPASVRSPICLSVGMLLRGRGPLFVFLRRLSISKSLSAEPMIESDKWSLSYLKAATLY